VEDRSDAGNEEIRWGWRECCEIRVVGLLL